MPSHLIGLIQTSGLKGIPDNTQARNSRPMKVVYDVAYSIGEDGFPVLTEREQC